MEHGTLKIRFKRSIVAVKQDPCCGIPALHEFPADQEFWLSRLDYTTAECDHDGVRIPRSCILYFAGADAGLGRIEGVSEDTFDIIQAMRIVG